MGTRDNSGTLGANKRREKDTHPTHTGQCTIEGKAYWISAWVKEGDSGRFFSLAFKPKEQRQASSQSRPKSSNTDDSGDIPF